MKEFPKMQKNTYFCLVMSKQLTIKQIAALAGVSAGTVDRVLHNRGKVSPAALDAVNQVLSSQAYKYNLHTSAVAFKKTRKSLRIIVAIPSSDKGEYWDLIRTGIDKAFKEYSDFDIESRYVFFDQFNSLSCRAAFETIANQPCSAVILGTTFVEETKSLCQNLSGRGIPYIFVDGHIPEASPVASFKADQVACGRLMARLMDDLTPEDKHLALLMPRRIGTQMSNNSSIRQAAFKDFFRDNNIHRTVIEAAFPAQNAQETNSEILSFIQKNPHVGGIAVVISAGYLVSDALKANGIKNIVVGGFDVTHGNARCIEEGTLDFLINQHPERQGFNAVESTLHYLLYGAPDHTLKEYLPIDIVFRENLPFWYEE